MQRVSEIHKMSRVQENDEAEEKETAVIEMRNVNALRQLCLLFVVTIGSLSTSVMLSEHSVTFEFSKFKFMCLARKTRLVQLSKLSTREVFGLSA